MKTYTVLLRTHKENWTPKFAFNANGLKDAHNKAYKWGQYHGFIQEDVTFRIATENEAANWLHNEYVK